MRNGRPGAHASNFMTLVFFPILNYDFYDAAMRSIGRNETPSSIAPLQTLP